ncbi:MULTISPECIES: ABC transporter permease [unclassified Corynebacterium]|uniref:ABC transporter permease n=1 Tax=unclassified Corynebacterium TaxID=2624378 RepID=UPI0026478748|nr:ABC transporter permease [Corynebacterium sp.]MDN5720166.1 ABC transporter permease [Corynebacterium sp.]
MSSRSSSATTMRRVSLRNLAAHKVRLVLTVLAVVLGTAFIAGSLMFTSSLQKTFDTLTESTTRGIDVVVSAPPSGTALPLDLADGLEDVPGVDRVTVSDEVTVVVATAGADGTQETLQTGGAPAFAMPWYAPDAAVGPDTAIVDGEAPQGPGEVVVNSTAAEEHGLSVGEELTVVDTSGSHPVTVSGIYDIDIDGGGFLGLMMDEPAFVDTFTDGATTGGFSLAAASGTGADALADEVGAYLAAEHPELGDVEVKTGEQVAADQAAEIDQALSFVNYFLIAFGLIALVVGTFIIANTFSMIVAQRMREFALLRSLGVASGQLTVSVVFEAVVVGIVGSLLGVLAGVGLTQAIYAVIGATGAGLPNTGVQVTVGSVVLPLILGMLVTVVSAWAPARRAGSVRPVEAMRSGDQSSSSPLRGRTVTGAVVLAVGVVAAVVGVLLDGASTGPRASLVGVGALAVILGTFLVSPALSVPVVRGIGAVVGAPFGQVGRLAATNSGRNPRRTATTAFALTLGVALVACIGMLGASMKASISGFIGDSVTSDYVLAGPSNGAFPVPQSALDAVRDVDGVADAAGFGFLPVTVGGYSGGTGVIDGDPTVSGGLVGTAGDVTLDAPGVVADEDVAASEGWDVGDVLPLTVRMPDGPEREVGEVTLQGTYEPNELFGAHLVSWSALEPVASQLGAGASPNLYAVFVDGDGSVSTDTLRDRLEDATADQIVVQVMTPEEYAGQQAVLVDQMLNVLYALLALAVVVAVLGIINTLALNVIERRQEIGMLRAVGTLRGQVRRMITLEAVQISLYGALLGVVVGLGLGWAFLQVLAAEGLSETAVPWGQVVGMVVASGVVGVVAAAWPAVKASRVRPLEAIAD